MVQINGIAETNSNGTNLNGDFQSDVRLLFCSTQKLLWSHETINKKATKKGSCQLVDVCHLSKQTRVESNVHKDNFQAR